MKLNYLLLHIRNIFLVFSHCDGWLREFGLCFPSYLYFCETGKQWLNNFMFIITLECSKLWIWMEIYFGVILPIRIYRGANNCVQRVFEKKHAFHNDISPYFKFLLPNERLDFCAVFLIKYHTEYNVASSSAVFVAIPQNSHANAISGISAGQGGKPQGGFHSRVRNRKKQKTLRKKIEKISLGGTMRHRRILQHKL